MLEPNKKLLMLVTQMHRFNILTIGLLSAAVVTVFIYLRRDDHPTRTGSGSISAINDQKTSKENFNVIHFLQAITTSPIASSDDAKSYRKSDVVNIALQTDAATQINSKYGADNVMSHRKLVMKQQCRRLRNKEWLILKPDWFRIFLDDRRRFAYCAIPKAGCTTWKTVLVRLSDKPQPILFSRREIHSVMRFTFNRANEYNGINRTSRFSNYFKFLFVREPMERLLSAYNDKMFKDQAYIHIRKIIQHRRQHGNTTAPVTFAEFARFVVETHSVGAKLDTHWRPQYQLCSPCSVWYDHIGHFETMGPEAEQVLAKLSSDGRPPTNVTFPQSDLWIENANTRQRLAAAFATVPRNIINRLLQLYKLDYELFDYQLPDIL